MSKHRIIAVVVVTLLLLVVGCKQAKPTVVPTAEAPTEAVEPTLTATSMPATEAPTAVLPTVTTAAPTATTVVQAAEEPATEEPQGPLGPELLAPPNDLAATIIDLVWGLDRQVGDNEWFEVHIWPDVPEATPTLATDEPRLDDIYGWYKDTLLRVTSANLLPGRYHWQVVVVDGRGDERAAEMTPYSEERTFIIVRPSVKADIQVPSPTAPTVTPTRTRRPTSTPVLWWPTLVPATPTNTPEEPTVTSTPEITDTPIVPTATSTTDPYAGATDTPVQPTATATTEPYGQPTNTPEIEPTATTGGYTVPTNTSAAPTNTPAGKVTSTPGGPTATTQVQPTAYP